MTWVRRYQYVSILDFIEAKDDGVVVTTGAIKRAKLHSNRHHQQTNTQFFSQAECHYLILINCYCYCGKEQPWLGGYGGGTCADVPAQLAMGRAPAEIVLMHQKSRILQLEPS